MADVNANIGVNIDTSEALAQLKALQREISRFHSSISRGSESAVIAQRNLQRTFIDGINSIGAFSAEMRTIRTTSESFTDSLEKNKFSMREYFRYASASTKTFGKLFRSEYDTIGKVAEDRVKKLQTQYIKMGRDASGAMKAIAIIPNELDMKNLNTQTQIAAQRQAIFNQLVKQGSTNLLNFGKNTQWAGRQLMVGFTLPLITLGSVATKTFMQMETAAIKFRKVYGDLFTPSSETMAALDNIKELGLVFTRYGIAVSDTVSLAADAAAAGFQGLDLQRQVTEATRLQVLGQIDQQKALETTISLQNAFQMSSEDLSTAINFLNAVENQTVVSLDDITTAVPKAAPIIQELGGNVKDLAFFMAAMKEGGINASEGANALKSGLASLINPTDKASAMLSGFGIDINKIVEKNVGNVKQTVIDFALALDNLSDLNRQRAIEQLFGKFQQARLSALFTNVIKDGNQASRVLELAGSSVEDLAALAERELGITADSAMNKFRASVEQLKVALVPVGELFLQIVTPMIQSIGDLLDKFNNLPSGLKKVIATLVTVIGGIAPVVLMTIGLFANFVANGIKGINLLRNGFLRLTGQSQILGEQTNFLTDEQAQAMAVAHSLDQSHARLVQTFTAEAGALRALRTEYQKTLVAASAFALRNPGMMKRPMPGFKSGILSIPGTGTEDKYPAMLAAGEAVIPAKQNKKYAGLIQGIIADSIPGFEKGRTGTGGTRVEIPGGFAAAHFGGSRSMTGNDLLTMLEGRTDKVAQSLRKMVEAMGSSDKEITVFTNEVVGMSSKLNQAVGKTGSNKKVSAEFARQELTSIPKSQVRDIELQSQLEKAGVPIKDIRVINQKITDEITQGFTKLGNITEVTAEDLDKLISTAYKKVAETDSRVDAAYKRMQEVTTLTDPTNNARRIITKKSYREKRKNKQSTGKSEYFEGMERMVGPGNVPFNPEAEFRITPAMGKSLGLSTKDASLIYAKFSDEVKLKLSKLRGDITAFTAEFEKQAQIAGVKTAQGYKKGLDANLKDPYVESRQRQSPHPLAAKDGKDDGNAYETARQSAIRKRRAASSPGGTVGAGGIIIPPIVGGASEGPMYGPQKPTRFDRTFGRVGGRFKNVGNKFASGKYTGAGFAATMAVSAASMAPGKTGQVAQNAMPVIFGLQALQMALKLPIPHIKLFAGVLLAGIGIVKLINSIREKERQKLEAFSDVLTTTTKQAEFLSSAFNFTPIQGSLENFGKNLEQTSAAVRTQREDIKKSQGFKEAYGQTIKQVGGMSDQQAQAALTFKGLELISQGMAREQVQLLIDSIKEEAGKTELKFDFKNIKFDKQGLNTINSQLSSSLQEFAKTYENGVQIVTQVTDRASLRLPPLITEKTIVSKEAKAALKNAGTLIASYSESINRLVKSGTIDAAQFKIMTDQMFSGINKAIPESTTQLALFRNTLKTIDPELAKVTKGVEDLKNMQLLLSAAIAGVSGNLIATAAAAFSTAEQMNKVAEANLKNLGIKFPTEQFASQYGKATGDAFNAQELLNKAIKDSIEYQKKLNEAAKNTNKNTKEVFNLSKYLTDQTTALNNQINAFNQLRKAKVDFATASELAGNADAAALLKTADGVKKVIKLIQDYADAKKRLEKIQIAGAELGDFTKSLLEMQKASFDLQEQLVKMKYSDEIEKQNKELTIQQEKLAQIEDKIVDISKLDIRPLQDQIDKNNDTLEKISFAEDRINEKYDKQEEALSRIRDIQDEINTLAKGRLSIADALSRGDIAAAAQAVQDLKSQQVNIQQNRQQNVLSNARRQELSALGRNKIEKENKDLQEKILNIQINKVRELEKEKRTVEDTIDTLRRGVRSTEYKIFVDTSAAQDKLTALFGMTKTQIENAMQALDLAKAAGIDINNPNLLQNIMKAAKGDATAINDLLDKTPGLTLVAMGELIALRESMNLPTVMDPRLKASLPRQVPDGTCPSGWAYEIVRYEDTDGKGVKEVGKQKVGCVPGGSVIVGDGAGGGIGPGDIRKKDEDTSKDLVPKPITPKIVTPEPITPKPVTPVIPKGAAPDEPTTVIPKSTAPNTNAIAAAMIADNPIVKEYNTLVASSLKPGATPSDFGPRLAALDNAIVDLIDKTKINMGANTVPKSSMPFGGGTITTTTKTTTTAKSTGSNTVPLSSLPFGGQIITSKPNIGGGGGGGLGTVLMMAKGGMVKPKYFAKGDLAKGSDKIPAMLSPGEFVVSKYGVQNYGVDKLRAINNGESSDSSVYNYSINVNVKSESSPDEIARMVMTHIKRVDSQRIRGQMV